MKSLCGHQYCPGVCERVCHCPAGLERSREQAAMYRNKREMSKSRTSTRRQYPVREDRQATPPGTQWIRQLIQPSFLLLFFLFMLAVLIWGFLVNGSNLVPAPAPDKVNYPQYEWQWEK